MGARVSAILRSSKVQGTEAEPRWPAVLAALAIGGLYLAVPERLTPGPSWGLLVIIVVLLIPTVAANKMGRRMLNVRLGFLISGLITLAMVWSLSLLIAGLPTKQESPAALLRAAASLWVSNILVFACWYWRLDAGGPHARDMRAIHGEGAFLFPQMTIDPARREKGWKPGFVDYLFLAFNTSTAFSPTDVPVLSRWAKLMMMVQSLISLGTVVILGARAINIL